MDITGKTFVFTGTSAYGRERLAAAVTEAGGKVETKVRRGQDYIVAGPNPGSKVVWARALGLKTVTENDIITTLGL